MSFGVYSVPGALFVLPCLILTTAEYASIPIWDMGKLRLGSVSHVSMLTWLIRGLAGI